MNAPLGPVLPNGEFYAHRITTPCEMVIKSHFTDNQRDRKIANQIAELADMSGSIEELFPSIELRIQRIAQTCFRGNMRSAIEQTQIIFNSLVPDPIQNANAVSKWHDYIHVHRELDPSLEMPRKAKDALRTPLVNRTAGQVAKVIDFENYRRRKGK